MRRTTLILLAVLLAAGMLPNPVLSAGEPPTRSAAAIREALFAAQIALSTDPSAAIAAVDSARTAYAGAFAVSLRATSPHADERILTQGTAFLTDAGMTGAFDSVIGMGKEETISRFLTQLPSKFEVAKKDIRLNGVVIGVDEKSGKAVSIERINISC